MLVYSCVWRTDCKSALAGIQVCLAHGLQIRASGGMGLV